MVANVGGFGVFAIFTSAGRVSDAIGDLAISRCHFKRSEHGQFNAEFHHESSRFEPAKARKMKE
jgi:hypothetical protein